MAKASGTLTIKQHIHLLRTPSFLVDTGKKSHKASVRYFAHSVQLRIALSAGVIDFV